MIKTAIKAGKVYVNMLHSTNEPDVYSPAKLTNIPTKKGD